LVLFFKKELLSSFFSAHRDLIYVPDMKIPFSKMHGAGNDFVVLDARKAPLPLTPLRVQGLADRRTGIGCDQLIVLEPPQTRGADVFMRIFNPDGSPAGACGNATRCVAEVLGETLGRSRLTVQTVAGLLAAERLGEGQVRIDMGPPALEWHEIPLAKPCNTLHLPLQGDPAAASMGNPHATLFVADLDSMDIAALGPQLETANLFPDRANIGFARVESPSRIRLRVWERGAGLTLACGSGACAALVNAHRRGLAGREAALILDGGTLHIAWREADGHVLMTGPTALAFQGTADLSTYPA
jgi:diaminopimelate epimerase